MSNEDNCCTVELSLSESPVVELDALGDSYIGEMPTMSTVQKGGAKVGAGLEVDSDEFLNIAPSGVVSEMIDNAAITTEKLADGAVTSAKVADESITPAKLSGSVIDMFDGNVKAFDTVAGMQADSNLQAGDICHTNGFHASGDGGAAFYKITASGTANGMDVLACGDVFANLITTNTINIDMLGATNANDAYSCFVRAIALAKTVVLGLHTYYVGQEIEIPNNASIIGSNSQLSKVIPLNNNTVFNITGEFSSVSDISFDVPSDYSNSVIKISTPDGHKRMQHISECYFTGVTKTGVAIEFVNTSYGSIMPVIEKCKFSYFSKSILSAPANGAYVNGAHIQDCFSFYIGESCIELAGSGLNTQWIIENCNCQYDGASPLQNINLLNSEKCVIDSCISWDGGIYANISTGAIYTLVRNFNLNSHRYFKNKGALTVFDETPQTNAQGKRKTIVDGFVGNTLSHYWRTNVNGGSVNTSYKTPSTIGYTLPCANIKTSAISGNVAILDFGTKQQLGRYQSNDIRFLMFAPSIENVQILAGFRISSAQQGTYLPQGYFFEIDSDSGTKINMTQVKYSSDERTASEIDITSSNWFELQIVYDSVSKFSFFVNQKFIGELTSSGNVYDLEPCFAIKTKTSEAKEVNISSFELVYSLPEFIRAS